MHHGGRDRANIMETVYDNGQVIVFIVIPRSFQSFIRQISAWSDAHVFTLFEEFYRGPWRML